MATLCRLGMEFILLLDEISYHWSEGAFFATSDKFFTTASEEYIRCIPPFPTPPIPEPYKVVSFRQCIECSRPIVQKSFVNQK